MGILIHFLNRIWLGTYLCIKTAQARMKLRTLSFVLMLEINEAESALSMY